MFTLLTLLAAAPTAQAVPIGWEGPNDELMCSRTCDRGGFTIKVWRSNDHDGQRVEFWPSTVTHTVDYDHKVPGDTFLGVQDATYANLAGGPYCRNFPGSSGTYILGSVYEHYESSVWTHEETDYQFTSANLCEASFHHLLNTLDTYGNGGDPLPSSCADLACVSGGGGGGSTGGSGGTFWTYTDAAGNEISFDDFYGDPGSSGTGGSTGGGLGGTDMPYSWQSAEEPDVAVPGDGTLAEVEAYEAELELMSDTGLEEEPVVVEAPVTTTRR